MNDVSRWISRTRPDDVDDPDDPALSDVLRYAGEALDRKGETPKATTLSDLMADGLNYQEAVVWYWFRYCQYDITEIHYAINGSSTGGDPAQRRSATRNILSVLKAAARKIDGADPGDVPDLIDERKRHDRTDDDL
jgi:hypothetical protein